MSHPNQPESAGLARVLGPVMTTAIVIGTIIGSGVFKKPAVIADRLLLRRRRRRLGPRQCSSCSPLVGQAEASPCCSRTGGNYVFLKEAYGRLAGFLWGRVDFWIIRSPPSRLRRRSSPRPLRRRAIAVRRSSPPSASSGTAGPPGPCCVSPTVATILGLGAVNIRGVLLGGFARSSSRRSRSARSPASSSCRSSSWSRRRRPAA
ncbi:MAG: hypothetical protein U0797_26575 [Gemmataceae bacterium]